MAGSRRDGKGGAVPRKPTLKTIAEICGLGVPTVSRAMNDSPEIGEETKRRIRRIAEEIGYVPDRAGQRLRTGRTNVISLAFAVHRDDQMGQLIASIAYALQRTAFQIAIAPVLAGESLLKPIRQVVEDRMADAVIFNDTLVDDPRVAYLLDRGFPFATHGRDALAHLHPHFDFDNQAYTRLAARLLHQRGRRSLALFGPPHGHNYGRDSLVGAMEGAAEFGLDFCEVDGARSNDTLQALQAAARSFVAKHPFCDGYVSSSGGATLAIVSALEQAGRVIGRDVDVIAKGSRLFLSMVSPAILAIEEDVGHAADFLIPAVLQAIRTPDLPPMQKVEQPDFSAHLS